VNVPPSHEPEGYECPFCFVVRGGETDVNSQSDVVFRDDATTAFVSPKWWTSAPAHVLVVPNAHYENIYRVPDDSLAAVYRAAKRIAIALRATYGCEGTSTRQHNEPAGYQDVWHLHVHVFPRYRGDDLYLRNRETRWASADERTPYAERLRAYLSAAS
jgi:histidine triad (HIT) family protein